jgi:hypothetical protein
MTMATLFDDKVELDLQTFQYNSNVSPWGRTHPATRILGIGRILLIVSMTLFFLTPSKPETADEDLSATL